MNVKKRTMKNASVLASVAVVAMQAESMLPLYFEREKANAYDRLIAKIRSKVVSLELSMVDIDEIKSLASGFTGEESN